MKKKYEVTGLKCANCAAKIEDQIKKLNGVEDASVSFLTEKAKMTFSDDADIDYILNEANKIADRIEPGTVIR